MKKLIILAVMMIAATAFAGNFHQDASGRKTDAFTPTAFYTYSATKANITHSTTGKYMVRFQPSAAVTYKLNGAGASYPVASGVNEGPFGVADLLGAGKDITSLVFSHASSATKTKVYIQEQ